LQRGIVVGAAWYALKKADFDLYNFLQNDLPVPRKLLILVQQGKSPKTEFYTIY
jgi:hypothetical protein